MSGNDLFYQKFFTNCFLDSSDIENAEEVEEPTEEAEEVEEPIEEAEEVEEPTEEAEEVKEPTEEAEEVEEPTEEAEEVEEPTEEAEAVSDSVSSEIIVSFNGIQAPLFVDNFSICIFLLSAILGVLLFSIFRSKL